MAQNNNLKKFKKKIKNIDFIFYYYYYLFLFFLKKNIFNGFRYVSTLLF